MRLEHLTYSEIIQQITTAYCNDYGERKYDKIYRKIETSSKVSDLFYESKRVDRVPNAMDFSSCVSSIPYFLFSKTDTVILGAFLALDRWHRKSDRTFASETVFCDISFRIIKQFENQGESLLSRFFRNVESNDFEKEDDMEYLEDETAVIEASSDEFRISIPDVKFQNFLKEEYKLNVIEGTVAYDNVKEIKEIWCDYGNIQSLEGIEYFTALTSLHCFENELTSLNVSQNTALTDLDCNGNQLTSLDVSQNTALTDLKCDGNQLTSLDVSRNTALTDLDCDLNELTNLDVSQNTALTDLKCGGNQLTSLDVSRNTALTDLDCDLNQLTNLDVTQNTGLTSLHCGENLLTSLDVSQNAALAELNCRQNKLTSLDVSQNTGLTNLYCFKNQLTSLDITQNTGLTSLHCNNNQLTSLDVSQNTDLTFLYCGENLLTSLDVSQMTGLCDLTCDPNILSSVDINWGDIDSRIRR